jgi:hypothetical protein
MKWQRSDVASSYEVVERVATRFSGFCCIFGCRGTASQFDSKAATVPRVCQAGGTLNGRDGSRRVQSKMAISARWDEAAMDSRC